MIVNGLERRFPETEASGAERRRPLRLLSLLGLLVRLGLLGLIGLLGLLGCSREGSEREEPVVVEDSTPIAFAGSLQQEGSVTRATPLEEKGVTVFTVYGFKNMGYNDTYGYTARQTVFPGYTVRWVTNSENSSTTNTDGWDYVNQLSAVNPEQTIKYWDWGAVAYRFFGVADGANVTLGTYKSYGTYEAYEITLTADGSSEEGVAATPYYSHLWFSTGNTTLNYAPFGQPVRLEFLKPLAKVRFMFIFENPNLARVTTLTDKSFCPTNGSNIMTNAEITISYPLTGTAVEESYAITSEPSGITAFTQDYYEEVTKESEEADAHVISPYYDAPTTPLSKIYTVLPATNQGTYTLTVSVNGEPKSTVVPAEFMDWKMGFLYTYIFKIHVDGTVGIDKVQSAFTTWTDHTTDYTVYNW